jgi:hypothetical protein
MEGTFCGSVSGANGKLLQICKFPFLAIGLCVNGLIKVFDPTSINHLGLVWLRAFPGGSPLFPRPNKPRVELARGSPPGRLDVGAVGFPRPFRSRPRESVPPLERWGTSSPTRSRDRRRRRSRTSLPSPATGGEVGPDRVLLPFASPLSPLPSPLSCWASSSSRPQRDEATARRSSWSLSSELSASTPLHSGKGDGDLPHVNKVILSYSWIPSSCSFLPFPY